MYSCRPSDTLYNFRSRVCFFQYTCIYNLLISIECSEENNKETDSSDSKSNDTESVKISNLRDKCEIFAESKLIESDEYFFILGDV